MKNTAIFIIAVSVLALVLIVAVFLLASPTKFYWKYPQFYGSQGMGMMGGFGRMGQGGFQQYYEEGVPKTYIPEQIKSNGELIYFTGYNVKGERIVPKNGPTWLFIHGGSCVSCHGVDGRGGVPIMMCNEIPPDIRWSSLTGEKHGKHGKYNETTVKIAITKGIEPNGEELSYCMPRWEISDEDLNDLLDFLKELDRRYKD